MLPHEPISIYYSFHEKDRTWLERLDMHLDGLRRQGHITTWHSGLLLAGTPIWSEIAYHWKLARVFILLISPDYLADECCHEQMAQAIKSAEKGQIQLLPVLLRPADLTATSLHQFMLLPRNGRPIILWRQKDLAFADIVTSISQSVDWNSAEPARMQNARTKIPSYSIQLDDLPPASHHSSLLQRTELVKIVYSTLLQPDVSSLVLTGLNGIGKSTLAAQIYHYAEEQRLAGKGPFHSKALWIRIKPTLTLKALATKIVGSLDHQFLNHIDALLPEERALKLFHLLDDHTTNRCIILDGIEVWLEQQKGNVQTGYTAIGEWLDLLNESPCASRILLTSRITPQSTHRSRKMYMRKVILDGLTAQEGMALLHLWGIQASEQEYVQVIELCKGHLFALVLLDKLLQRRHIRLTSVLNDSIYKSLWLNDVAHTLFEGMYKQLNDIQRVVLMAFAADHEVVPWHIVYNRMQGQITAAQFLKASGTLLRISLLQIEKNGQEGYYTLHPLIAQFVQEYALHQDKQDIILNKPRTSRAKALSSTIWHKFIHLMGTFLILALG